MMVLAKTILSEEDEALTGDMSLEGVNYVNVYAPNSPHLNQENYNIWLEMW